MRHEKQIGRQRQRRGFRVRNRLKRHATRPRLSIFRSHQNFYAQIVDDDAGRTLVAASTRDKQLRDELRYGGNKTAAAVVGKVIAQRAWKPASRKWCSTAANTSITVAWPRWPMPLVKQV